MAASFNPTFTRRTFLGSSAALLGTSALHAAPAPSPKFRRFEITDPAMPPKTLVSYAKGVTEMLNRPPTDPLNWYRNAFTHVFDCPHQNWWFLAWHRGYIGWLEAKIRELSGDPDFALPYWDWTKTPSVPAGMFNGALDPNNSAFIKSFTLFKSQFNAPVNALYGSFSGAQKTVLNARGVGNAAALFAGMPQPQGMFFDQPNARGLTAANPNLDSATKVAVSMATIKRALRVTTFAGSATGTGSAGFASAMAQTHNDGTREGILESQPHDNVHGAMGGPGQMAFMVSFMSPIDPIFFLHHANLDRLWDVWTRRQAALGKPTLPTGANLTKWSNERFLFFTNEKGQAATKTMAGDYATMASFDYDYSPGSGEDLVPAAGPLVAALPPPQRVAVALRSRQIGAAEPAGGIAQVPKAMLAQAPDAPAAVAEVTLNLTPADRGRRFRVFMSVGGGNPVDAGAITVFSHHVHGPTTFTVPIPEELATGAGDTSALDIRVVPIEQAPGAAPGPAPTGAEPKGVQPTARGAAPRAAPQVGAISLTTD